MPQPDCRTSNLLTQTPLRRWGRMDGHVLQPVGVISDDEQLRPQGRQHAGARG
jgi:hypothetical protein